MAVYVHADDGRVCRPLLVVANLARLPALLAADYHSDDLFGLLLRAGVVEYVDKQEEAEYVVAPDAAAARAGGCSHMEIHSGSLFGHSTAQIPFSNHNQAPRNMYQTSMLKQAISGMPSLVPRYRSDVHAHSLAYPMRPLVTTAAARNTTINGTHTGQDAIVAIMSYTATKRTACSSTSTPSSAGSGTSSPRTPTGRSCARPAPSRSSSRCRTSSARAGRRTRTRTSVPTASWRSARPCGPGTC